MASRRLRCARSTAPRDGQRHRAALVRITGTGTGMARSLLGDALLFSAGAALGALLLLTLASPFAPPAVLLGRRSSSSAAAGDRRTFYDDPEVTYTVDRPITGWDEKRAQWLRAHPELAGAGEGRVLMVSGSQPTPCRSPTGDHVLTRLLKNKADYCRLNGVQLLYNTALLRPSMDRYWAKIPLIRAAMVAHPEAEWVWWVDSDAVLTDMDFRLPLRRYRGHNFVVNGWPSLVYDEASPSWTGLNAGVFLVRNCQWSLDFMDAWAAMGPDSPDYRRWGAVLTSTFKDKVFNESDDQSALVYMLQHKGSPWRDKVFLENDYYFQGYWVEIVGRLGDIAARYETMERRAPAALLRRRHAASWDHAAYAAAREAALAGAGLAESGVRGWRRPFVTHFTGCQPCSGDWNRDYSGDSCDDGMRRALNFADDQVLRDYGFRHAGPLSDDVRPLPFDYPAAAGRR
ncbi:probable glycosyltransferase 7 [Triticum dicoccoides]|nr:probable glycosyltransferase 7 [Triticum dicoccoides]